LGGSGPRSTWTRAEDEDAVGGGVDAGQRELGV
jgi:hypothetical protein